MEQKRQLRAAIRASRSGRNPADAAAGNAALTAQLVALTQRLGARRVSCFVSVRGEPDTSGYLAWAAEHGIEVLLPRVRDDGELEWALHEPGAFALGAYGISEPTGETSPLGAAESAELLLIPAAAVDESGTRLGWGKGFFDRELARVGARAEGQAPALFAVVWDDEVLAELPREPHDVPVHGAVTEERTLYFG